VTVTPYFTVFCDEPGCVEWEGQESSIRLARGLAKDRGWIRKRAGDFCPLHGGDVSKVSFEFKQRNYDELAELATT
jgi:hypothetical protein